MEIAPAASKVAQPYSEQFMEDAYLIWRSDAGQNNFSKTSKMIDVDRGTLSRWARDNGWWQRHAMESSTMSTQDERRVTQTIAEINGPSAISLIVGIIHGDIESDKTRLRAAETLLNRIGFPEMKITEYIERSVKPEKTAIRKPLSEMTEEEMIEEQRRLTEPQER